MTLLEQFDALLDPPRYAWFGGSGVTRAFLPPADLIADKDEVTIVMDVPGLKAEDLTIELTGDVLTVKGERAYPYASGERQGGSWHRLERSFGSFQRVLQVPKGLDPAQITATVDDGVLTLRIPQPEHRKPRRIQITTAGHQPAIETSAAEPAPASEPTEEPAFTAAEERELAGTTA